MATTSRLLWASSKAASYLKISTFNRAFASSVVEDLKYSHSHVWAKVEGNCATIGITDHAQDRIKDVVDVDLPRVGEEMTRDGYLGTLETVRFTHDVICPVAGKVTEVNEELPDYPIRINRSPYEEGWMIKVEMSDKNEVNSLMDSEDYSEYCEEEPLHCV